MTKAQKKLPRTIIQPPKVLPGGQAAFSDGTILQPGRANPWYVLATLYGEQGPGRFSEDLKSRNRRAWNIWSCQALPSRIRRDLSRLTGLGEDELGGHWGREEHEITARFGARLGPGVVLPDPAVAVDFSRLYFGHRQHFTGYIFSSIAHFEHSFFQAGVDFSSARFEGVKFDYARLSKANFTGSYFGGPAVFAAAAFQGYTQFVTSTFKDNAVFFTSAFYGPVGFERAEFLAMADFSETYFSETASFNSSQFESTTNFENADFGSVPYFHDCRIYQDTRFSMHSEHWPVPREERQASFYKPAYARLRQMMHELSRPDEEHFFLRREMKSKIYLEPSSERIWVLLYGYISDYGYSVWRPLLWLISTWIAGALVIQCAFAWAIVFNQPLVGMEGVPSLFSAFGLGIANTFAIFGFRSHYFGVEFMQSLPIFVKLVGGAQTILGFVCLFFLGLGLRNRFRLK